VPRYNPLLDVIAEYPFEALDRLKARLRASGQRVFDFTKGDPVEPAPEFVRQALLSAVPAHCPYPRVRGRPPVRQAIADYLQRRFSVTIDPDTQVLPTAGAKEAVFHLPLLVIDPAADDRLVVFPDPGYPACDRGARFAGGETLAVPLEGDHVFRPWELPVSVLDRTRLLWINTPHNPSGAVTSRADLARTAQVCADHDILLVSDETYADIYTPGGTPPASILEVADTGILALHSLSKRSGMTGYRSGFLTGDPDIIGRLATLRANPGLVPQDFVNAAATAAWSDDVHVEARRAVFAEKKQVFLDLFDDLGVQALGRHAAIYLWVRVPDGLTDIEYAERLVTRGVVVSPGSCFAVGNTDVGGGYVRLAMVPDLASCHEAARLWREVHAEL